MYSVNPFKEVQPFGGADFLYPDPEMLPKRVDREKYRESLFLCLAANSDDGMTLSNVGDGVSHLESVAD